MKYSRGYIMQHEINTDGWHTAMGHCRCKACRGTSQPAMPVFLLVFHRTEDAFFKELVNHEQQCNDSQPNLEHLGRDIGNEISTDRHSYHCAWDQQPDQPPIPAPPMQSNREYIREQHDGQQQAENLVDRHHQRHQRC